MICVLSRCFMTEAEPTKPSSVLVRYVMTLPVLILKNLPE